MKLQWKFRSFFFIDAMQMITFFNSRHDACLLILGPTSQSTCTILPACNPRLLAKSSYCAFNDRKRFNTSAFSFSIKEATCCSCKILRSCNLFTISECLAPIPCLLAFAPLHRKDLRPRPGPPSPTGINLLARESARPDLIQIDLK